MKPETVSPRRSTDSARLRSAGATRVAGRNAVFMGARELECVPFVNPREGRVGHVGNASASQRRQPSTGQRFEERTRVQLTALNDALA